MNQSNGTAARDPRAVAELAQALADAGRQVAAAEATLRRRRALAAAVARVPNLAVGVAVVAAPLVGFANLPFWAPPVALAALTGLAYLQRLLAQPVAAADWRAGAAACDRANDNHDRLAAAAEFAAAPAESPANPRELLVVAAIADGLDSLQRIDRARLALAATTVPVRQWPAWLAAALVTLLPWLLPAAGPVEPQRTPVADVGPGGAAASSRARPAVDPTDRTAEVPAAVPERNPADAKKSNPPRQGVPPPPPSPGEPVAAVPAASGQGQAGSDAAGDSAQTGAPKAAPTGNPGSGQSGGGQGSAASGAPEPTPSEAEAKPPAKPKPRQPQREQPQQDQKPSESAGAPSGPSRGSGRMSAVGNKRNDLNRGQERDDDPEVEDEPVEDESDEQEQRGGVMPMRRGDNRPAARELSISGDGPPDQGRGGPTPPKKSRGTASLVLGLRLADAVRGQPNPGTAKTSLEQIPPRPSSAAPGLARSVPAGRPTTPQSQRRPTPFGPLLRSYHEWLRARETAPAAPTASTNTESPKDPR
jgi:hypothetical protein